MEDQFIERREADVQLMLNRMRAVWDKFGEGLTAQRDAFHAVGRLFPDPVAVTERSTEVGGVPAIETEPSASLEAGAPVLLYLHGGAFLIGASEIYREQSARISTGANARVVSLDYRLAPEHPFPSAVDDVVRAYHDLLSSDVPADRIVIGGDSAGGNLTLAATIRLRDDAVTLPAGLLLISPWVDLTCSGSTMETNANPRHLAQKDGLLACAETYLNGTDPQHPEASPLFGDLSGLPPTLVQVGSEETLLDDSLKLNTRLDQSDVPVQLHVYDGMIHEWHLLAGLLPPENPLVDSQVAVSEIGSFVRQVTSR